MIIKNLTHSTKYIDLSTFTLKSEKETTYQISQINNLNFRESVNAHEHNSALYTYTPDIYQPVVNNIVPIPSKSSWSFSSNVVALNETMSLFKKRVFNLNDLTTSIIKLIHPLKNKKFGVQLSGGLDSSLIIGILRHVGIEPVLIGMSNDRYEFRTERIIQEILLNGSSNNKLICDDDYLPFSELLNIPKHPLPNSSSIFYSSENKMAQLFAQQRVDIVLNGMGLDTILCLSPNSKFRKQWYPFMFDNGWFRDFVYRPKGIDFSTAINSTRLINSIWNLRIKEGEDNSKEWARNHFSDFIPNELVNFRYKADHAGLLIDGIKSNFKTLEYLYELAFEKTKCSEFSKDEFVDLFRNYHLNDDKKIKLILSRTSYAVWLYSLFKDKMPSS
jgi:hypothetical protein